MSAVELRPARREDAQLLFDWRNDPQTRAGSRNRGEVTWDEHVGWLERVLADPQVALMVAESKQRPVGQVRFDGTDAPEVEISVSIDPGQRGRGLGKAVIGAGVAWLAQHHPDAVVVAEIRPDNDASLRAFERSGFMPAGVNGGMVRLQRPPRSASS